MISEGFTLSSVTNMKDFGQRSGNDSSHVCPWWLAYSFDNPLRRWIHRPRKLLAPYVKEGMRAIDVGCGMGVFSIAMAKLVGESGRVTAIDLQEKMLAITRKRAKRAGIGHRIHTLQGTAGQLEGAAHIDFALAFWMVHEVPDRLDFFTKIHNALKPDGMLLVAEPAMHVTRKDFDSSLQAAYTAGFLPHAPQTKIRLSLSKVLVKQQR